ncbi:MAG: replication-associated recombination protein A [Planctomycetota bacterium]
MTLFGDLSEENGDSKRGKGPPPPLAERMRPATLDEYLGQDELLGEGRALRAAIEQGVAGSLVLFGPPGVGKTTLALLIAKHASLHFQPFSAVLSGVAQVREAVAEAARRRRQDGVGTLLFVDEIHRFNKAQQDAFLPHVERGDIVLVGATTENPSYAINGALLSRCRVVSLQPLGQEQLAGLVRQALSDQDRGLGVRGLTITDAAVRRLAGLAGGDARRSLVCIEACAATCVDGDEIDESMIVEAFQHRVLQHDKSGDLHYDLLSALHKSLRNSDVQAAVYWLARALEAGADPQHAARRLVAVAAEDVGLADPMALQVAMAAVQALQFLGLPEGRLPLTEAVVYLAAAPKSNAAYRAIGEALRVARSDAQHPVPLHLRNASNAYAKQEGHGDGYVYAHDTDAGVAPMSCLPDELKAQRFYRPGDRGFEQRIAERMKENDRLRGGGSGGGGGRP